MSFDDFTKTYFRWKLHTLPDAELIIWAVFSWIINKFSIEMPNKCGYVAGGLKIFNCYLVQTKRSKSQRTSQIGFLWYFFPPWVPLISKHHQNWHKCRALCYLCKHTSHRLQWFLLVFSEVEICPKYPKLISDFLLSGCSGLTHCQVATLKKLGILKLEENRRTVT